MNRRSFIKRIGATTIACSLSAGILGCKQSNGGKEKRKPNVIYILSDDHGTVDVNCYGSKDLHTPAMDKLAVTGSRFTQFYAASPICSPSRASFLSGKTPQGAGLTTNVVEGAGRKMSPSTVTIAEAMKAGGYTRMIKILDDELENAVINGFLIGDRQAVQAWNKAIGLRREFGKVFQSEKIVDIISSRELYPDDAVSVIFGTGQVFNGKESAKAVHAIRDLVGPDSVEWQMFRDEAMRLITQSGQKVGEFSKATFSGNFATFLRKHPELAKSIWAPEEIAMIRGLATLRMTDTGFSRGMEVFSKFFYLRHGLQGGVIAGTFRRLGNSGALQSSALGQPLFSRIGGQAGVAAARERNAQSGGDFTEIQQAVGNAILDN